MRSLYPIKSLGDVLILQYGKPLPESARTSEGGVPAYGANGVLCQSRQAFRTKPSIIVGRKGSAGEINLTEGPFWPTDVTYFVEHDNRESDLRYLFYALKLLNLQKLAKGVKPGVNRNDAYALKIPMPSLHEQKRIVVTLDEAFEGIDTATANAKKNLANARKLFENYLNSVFVKTGNGWTHKKLGDVATFKNGLNFTKGSKGETIKIVGVKDFQKNFSVPMDQLETAQIDGSLSADYELRPGDILTVRSNGNKQLIGRCMLSGYVPEKTSHSGFTIRIRMISADVSSAYLVHFLKSKASREMLVESGDGANISSLNQQALATLPVSLPSLSEQVTIAEKIEAVAAETKSLESIYQHKLTALSELKQAVLQRAFSGELTARSAGAMPQAAE